MSGGRGFLQRYTGSIINLAHGIWDEAAGGDVSSSLSFFSLIIVTIYKVTLLCMAYSRVQVVTFHQEQVTRRVTHTHTTQVNLW